MNNIKTTLISGMSYLYVLVVGSLICQVILRHIGNIDHWLQGMKQAMVYEHCLEACDTMVK
jgi:hypothetical protein